jgi:hypothetical protein
MTDFKSDIRTGDPIDTRAAPTRAPVPRTFSVSHLRRHRRKHVIRRNRTADAFKAEIADVLDCHDVFDGH